jgi:hypothetical protein
LYSIAAHWHGFPQFGSPRSSAKAIVPPPIANAFFLPHHLLRGAGAPRR